MKGMTLKRKRRQKRGGKVEVKKGSSKAEEGG